MPSSAAIGTSPRAPVGAGPDPDNLLRPFPPTPPRVLLIGASTGGPQALNALVARHRRR